MNPIFLIGYMGSGKTTIGQLIAKQLNKQFIDLDRWIENRFHRSIHDLFEAHGEEWFRKVEHENLKEVSFFQDVVISTGGGAACYYQNMEWMNDHGMTIYLSVPVATLTLRLRTATSKRPLLKNKTEAEIKQFIEENLAIREPFYRQAKIRLDIGNEDPLTTSKRIVQLIDAANDDRSAIND
ncbi:MAG: shikimate kinase [Microbacter sp.]